jgi:hypothetical protein
VWESAFGYVQKHEKQTIIVITAFFAPICNQGPSPIYHPFSIRLAALSSTSIWTNSNTDDDIALPFVRF